MTNHIEFQKQEKITGEIILATVSDDASGIHIRLRTEDSHFVVCFTPKEAWGHIPSDKDPRQELEKVAELLNGFRKLPNGETEKISNFVPKVVIVIKN